MHRCLVVPALVVLVALTTASPARATDPGARSSGTITVSAAASLTDAFTAIGERFRARNPTATIRFNFGSSSALVRQIEAGAPADVFASADLATMDALVAGGRVTVRPTPFARNRMAIATKPGNPQAIEAVADLTEVGTVALCGATVPCGIYAARVLQKAGVRIPESRITRGADAKATLAAVARGDADATIVYATDVTAAGRMVTGVPIPEDANVTAVYPVAPLATSDHPRTAKAFVRFVVSPVGQRILARHGFLPV